MATAVLAPNVVRAQRLFGGPDYLLRVVTADLAAYQQPEDGTLAALPGVQRLTSILVMKQVVTTDMVPHGQHLGRLVTLVRAGSVQHREPLVLGGHDSRPSASAEPVPNGLVTDRSTMA